MNMSVWQNVQEYHRVFSAGPFIPDLTTDKRSNIYDAALTGCIPLKFDLRTHSFPRTPTAPPWGLMERYGFRNCSYPPHLPGQGYDLNGRTAADANGLSVLKRINAPTRSGQRSRH
jgi:hypothetical protein